MWLTASMGAPFGVHSAMPISQPTLLSQLSFAVPGALSSSVRTYFRYLRALPMSSKLSIDEAFLDVTVKHSLFGTVKYARAQPGDSSETASGGASGGAPNSSWPVASDLGKPSVLAHATDVSLFC